MATLTEANHTAEFLVSEAAGTRSRDEVTVNVPAETVYEPGSVLGIVTATGNYAEYDDANTDGTEVAAGVLLHEVRNDTQSPATAAATVINADAEVRLAGLVFADSVDEDGAVADLRAVGIKAR